MAGAIHGVVVDEQTRAPVAGAVVRIRETGRGEATHGDGAFHLDRVAAGRYTLVATRVGYAPAEAVAEVTEAGTTQVTLAMRPSAVELGAVVVTGSLSPRSGDEVLSPTSVLAGARLERRLDATVAATVAGTPGVSVTSIGPATGRPVIRGLSGDRVLVLEDGQRPGDLSSTSGDHAVATDVITAQRIEVVRGPMSLLYGSSALGGVVNVVREEVPTTLPEHLHGTAATQLSSVDRGTIAGGTVSASRGPVAMRLEGSARRSGDLHTPVGELTNTETQTLGLSAGAAYVGDWGHAGGAYRFYDNDYGIPGGFIGAHPRGVDIRMRRHTLRGEAELRPGAGPLASLRGAGTFTDYQHTEFESSGSVRTRFNQRLVAGDLSARHDALGPLSQGAAGVHAQFRDITTGGSLKTPSTYDWSLAGFAVEEVGSGPFRLQFGARYDWARYTPRETDAFVDVGGERIPVRPRTFGAVSGSLGGLYTLMDGVRVGASVSRAYRTPDFNELYSNGPHLAAGTYDVGDPSLRTETGVGADLFVRVERPGLRAEAAAFRNQLDGYVFPSSRGRVELGAQGGVARAQYTNEDAVFAGWEADVEWSVARRLVLESTVSSVDARFTSQRTPIPVIEGVDTTFIAASRYPPLIPPLHGRAGLRWDAGRWSLGGAVRAAARQDRTGDFEDATDGYVVGDLTAGLRLQRGVRVHSITLRLDNVANTEYRDHLARTKAIMPEPGRSLSLLYRLTY